MSTQEVLDALSPNWPRFLSEADAWFTSNETRLRESWPPSIDAATLLSFELGAYLYDPAGSRQFDVTYDATPRDSFTFASTGVDGEHFSVLLTPPAAGVIVMTAPMAFGNENLVVGESMREFLRLACGAGFAVLPDLAMIDRERAIAALAPPQPDDRDGLLQQLRTNLDLAPWPRVKERLDKLAERFDNEVRMTAELD